MSSQKRAIRIVSALLTLSILFTSLPAVFAAGTTPFTDVRESDWFYDAVARAYDKKLFNGTSATTFSPNTPMTRAMLATVLYRLDGERDTESMPNPFHDVDNNSWYAFAVQWAYCSDYSFRSELFVESLQRYCFIVTLDIVPKVQQWCIREIG